VGLLHQTSAKFDGNGCQLRNGAAGEGFRATLRSCISKYRVKTVPCARVSQNHVRSPLGCQADRMSKPGTGIPEANLQLSTWL
jgi:hypothetical protein